MSAESKTETSNNPSDMMGVVQLLQEELEKDPELSVALIFIGRENGRAKTFSRAVAVGQGEEALMLQGLLNIVTRLSEKIGEKWEEVHRVALLMAEATGEKVEN